jgi:hypothetical protein
MSDYAKATNFTTKDTLPTGNSGKIVKGTEIDVEFTAIASAIASKANISSPDLLGTPTAPTATTGSNTTQIASTAFVTTALSAMYPIGSIYINAAVSTNPATLLGFGTWAAFGAGKVIVGLDSADALFDTLEETGGSKDAIVVTHTHTATSTSTVTDPTHTHQEQAAYSGSGSGPGSSTQGNPSPSGIYTVAASTGITVATTTTNANAGSSATNANVQPYIVVKMWKRTA